MKLLEFNGGLATRQRPHLININEAVVYDNIDNALGTLVPVKDKLDTNINCSRFNYWSTALQRWFTSSSYKYYVDFENAVYYTDGVTAPVVNSVGSIHSMGITAPVSITGSAAVTVQSTVVTDVTTSSVPDPTVGLPVQDIVYKFINDSAGVYSSQFEVTVNNTTVTRATAVATGRLVGRVMVAASTYTKRIITLSNVRTATFGSNGVRVFRQYKDVWRQVGVLANATASLVDNTEDISANLALDPTKFSPLEGVYQYCMTYYDNTNGRESGPSPVTPELNVADTGVVNFTGLPSSSDPTVTHKRLYRVGGNTTTFTMVTQLANGTTTYTDNVKDVNLTSTTLTTDIFLPAPIGLKYLVSANTMLFGAVASDLGRTPVGYPEAWPTLYFVKFDADITAIAVVYSGIIVCTLDKTYIITGSGPTSLAKNILSLDQGCLGQQSMQVLKGTALWVSAEGICASSGEAVTVVSRPKLGALNIIPEDSALVNEVYYVLAGSIVYAFDMALGNIFKTFDLGVNSLAKSGTSIYGHYSGKLYKLFSGTENLTFTYKSPRFVEGRCTEHKLYKKVYIYSKGDIICKVYINDVLVATKTLSDEDSHTIQVPQELQRGFFTQLELSGTGEVYEIEYEVGRGK
ncbi:hypothetical protein [Caudoviricetes sp.]|nr:hypothetical protein [Caudoviricetes sp.]